MGGLDAFQFFICGGHSRGEFSSYEPSEHYTVPIPYMYRSLQAFSEVFSLLREEKMNEILNCITKCIKHRSKNSSEHEIKIIEMTSRFYKSNSLIASELSPILLNYLKKMIKNPNSGSSQENVSFD